MGDSNNNSYLLPNSDGQVSSAGPNTFPQFGERVVNASTAVLGSAYATEMLGQMGGALSSAQGGIASIAGGGASAGAGGLSSEESVKLWQEKHALESGQVEHASAQDRVEEINGKLGLHDSHRGSSHIGKF